MPPILKARVASATLLALLIGSAAFAQAPSASPSQAPPNIAGLTIEQVAAKSNYTVQEIRKYFPPIQAWASYGLELAPDKIADSFAKDRFHAPPAPGIHPRVYFNPEDLPAIRKRLTESQIGRVQMQGMRGMLLQIAPTGDAWQQLGGSGADALIAKLKGEGILAQRRAGYLGPLGRRMGQPACLRPDARRFGKDMERSHGQQQSPVSHAPDAV